MGIRASLEVISLSASLFLLITAAQGEGFPQVTRQVEAELGQKLPCPWDLILQT